MKSIILMTLALMTFSLKLQESHKKANHEQRWMSADNSTWFGYYPQCEYQCIHDHEGQVCDSNPTVCCQEGECISKYGFQTCKVPVLHFKCDPSNHMRSQYEQFFMRQQPRLRKYMRPKQKN